MGHSHAVISMHIIWQRQIEDHFAEKKMPKQTLSYYFLCSASTNEWTFNGVHCYRGFFTRLMPHPRQDTSSSLYAHCFAPQKSCGRPWPQAQRAGLEQPHYVLTCSVFTPTYLHMHWAKAEKVLHMLFLHLQTSGWAGEPLFAVSMSGLVFPPTPRKPSFWCFHCVFPMSKPPPAAKAYSLVSGHSLRLSRPF